MAISLSERLSLEDLGAAGNSISNFDSFDIVPLCSTETTTKSRNPTLRLGTGRWP